MSEISTISANKLGHSCIILQKYMHLLLEISWNSSFPNTYFSLIINTYLMVNPKYLVLSGTLKFFVFSRYPPNFRLIWSSYIIAIGSQSQFVD